jgi:hypothetical protein
MTALITIAVLCGVSAVIGGLLRSSGSAYPTPEEMQEILAARDIMIRAHSAGVQQAAPRRAAAGR